MVWNIVQRLAFSEFGRPTVAEFDAPGSAEDVDRLLTQLIAADADTRIAAANALAKTPPQHVGHLKHTTIEPACATSVSTYDGGPLPEVCTRWNHAMYHYVRVVSGLARQSTDPSTDLGAWCLPKTQPRPGDMVEDPACGLASTLRWMVVDGFDDRELLDDEASKTLGLPDAVAGSALEKAAWAGWMTALSPTVPLGFGRQAACAAASRPCGYRLTFKTTRRDHMG